MEVQDKFKKLMIGELQGELTPEERQNLFAWVYGDKSHKKLFYELKDIWDSSNVLIKKDVNRQQDEWAKLWNEIETLESKSAKTNLSLFGKHTHEIFKIAATLVVAFGISWYMINKFQKTDYNTIEVPYGAKTNLTLADGTKIWLNSGTNLKYPTLVKNDNVEVYLEGEAFFDVAHLNNRRFNVKTSTINIQVLGTRFNVKSYEDEEVVAATLEEGKISIVGTVGDKIIDKPIVLSPNEQALLQKGSTAKRKNKSDIERGAHNQKLNKSIDEIKLLDKPSLMIAEKVDTEEFTSWKDNKLVFKSETFEELTKKMERWYDVKILIHDSKLKNSKYSGTFEEENIEQALTALSMSLPFKYDIDKNRIDIYRKKPEPKKSNLPMR